MLLSDGSVTRHLQLMTDQRVEVECLEMRNIGDEREGLPHETELIPGPLVQRQVRGRAGWGGCGARSYVKEGLPAWLGRMPRGGWACSSARQRRTARHGKASSQRTGRCVGRWHSWACPYDAQVFLHIPDPHSKPYVYATSWWNAEEVESYLRWVPGGDPWPGLGRSSASQGLLGGRSWVGSSTVWKPLGAARRCRCLPCASPSFLPPVTALHPALPGRDRSQPIWVSLSQGRAELYREILQVQYGASPFLEE